MSKNIENFDTVVGMIFAQLYAAFPVAVELDMAPIATAMGVTFEMKMASNGHAYPTGWGHIDEKTSFWEFSQAVDRWLLEHDYIRADRTKTNYGRVLSEKGLVVLNLVPGGIGPSLGNKLVEAAKGAGREAGKAALVTMVAQVIGAGVGAVIKVSAS